MFPYIFRLGETFSHVAAILYKVEAAVQHGLTSQTCTDIPCQWNQTFKESVQPAPVSDIKFYSKSATESISCSSKKKKEFNGQSHIKDLLDLVSNKNPNTVALSLFMSHLKRFITKKSKNVLKLPKPLMLLYDLSNRNLDKNEMEKKIDDIIINMTVTNEEVQYLEASTKNQSDSLVRHQLRIGRITSSLIHAIARISIDNPAKSLIKKICYMSTNQVKVPSLSWGRDKEQLALLAYFNTFSDPDFIGDSLCINPLVNLHTDFEIQESGLMLKQNEH